MKKSLHDIAINIFSNCIQNQISLEVEWIPRSENEVADYLSKMYDYDDWSISDTVFQFFNNKWGPYLGRWRSETAKDGYVKDNIK